MITLIELECRKCNLRGYVKSAIVITFVMLGFLYLFAYAPMLEPNDEDMAIFSGYQNLIPMFVVLQMAVFSVLSAVMHAKLVIEEYTGKRVMLLFSYPVSRPKVLLSKLILVSAFTVTAMVLSSLVIFTVFGITERIVPLVNDSFTLAVFGRAAEITLVLAFAAAGIGTVAAGIGFMMKSVPAAIVAAVLAASAMCNIAVYAADNRNAMYLPTAGILIAAAAVSLYFAGKVNRMEAV